MSLFECAYFRKTKGRINVHIPFDVVTQIPTNIHITEAILHNVKAMDDISYEPNAFNIFDKEYYDLARLCWIQCIDSISIIRAKEHLKYEIVSGDDLLDVDDNVLLGHHTIRLRAH